jgi:hypothetical protein
MERYPELNYRNFLKHEAGLSRQRLQHVLQKWDTSTAAFPLLPAIFSLLLGAVIVQNGLAFADVFS